MDFIQKEEKLLSSESMEHERVSEKTQNKKMEGYEPNPKDHNLSEMFGLKSSFDNLSVGTDDLGRLTISVSSQKGYHSDTLTSDKKKLKGSRRRTFYDHFGEFYTNPFSKGKGAFAFRTRRNLPESRILRELRGIASRRISEEQREAMPILSLEEDKKRLTSLRSGDEKDPQIIKEKQAAEKVIVRKTEMENRFIRRLRIARMKTYKKTKPDNPRFLEHLINIETDISDENDLPDDNTKPDKADITDEINNLINRD